MTCCRGAGSAACPSWPTCPSSRAAYWNPVLEQIAREHGATPAQVALAWVLRQDGIIAIPKAGTAAHVQDNRAALDGRLTANDLAALDRAFPPPTRATPLELL